MWGVTPHHNRRYPHLQGPGALTHPPLLFPRNPFLVRSAHAVMGLRTLDDLRARPDLLTHAQVGSLFRPPMSQWRSVFLLTL